MALKQKGPPKVVVKCRSDPLRLRRTLFSREYEKDRLGVLEKFEFIKIFGGQCVAAEVDVPIRIFILEWNSIKVLCF